MVLSNLYPVLFPQNTHFPSQLSKAVGTVAVPIASSTSVEMLPVRRLWSMFKTAFHTALVHLVTLLD